MKIHSQSKKPACEESIWHGSWEVVSHTPTQPTRDLITPQPPLSSTTAGAATWTQRVREVSVLWAPWIGLNTFQGALLLLLGC